MFDNLQCISPVRKLCISFLILESLTKANRFATQTGRLRQSNERGSQVCGAVAFQTLRSSAYVYSSFSLRFVLAIRNSLILFVSKGDELKLFVFQMAVNSLIFNQFCSAMCHTDINPCWILRAYLHFILLWISVWWLLSLCHCERMFFSVVKLSEGRLVMFLQSACLLPQYF